jgi:hypothetical protein
MKLAHLLEDKTDDLLSRMIFLRSYIGEHNLACEVELIDDQLVLQDSTGKRMTVDDEMLKSLNSSTEAYYYARDVIKGRFEMGEPVIAKNMYSAYAYARKIIKGRFELGEKVIMSDDFYTKLYEKFLKGKQ